MRRTLTEKEWNILAGLARQAAYAVDTLETQLLLFGAKAEDLKTIEVLSNLRRRVQESNELHSLAYYMTPQPEWTGGDSADQKNFKVREPHCMPSPQRYLEK